MTGGLADNRRRRSLQPGVGSGNQFGNGVMISKNAAGDRLDASLRISAVFNRTAAVYDREPLRFFAFAADRLIAHAGIRTGYKLLDAATGTGAAAIAAAQIVGPSGRVVAIDLAAQMLDRVQARISQFGIANIDLHQMDAGHVEFRTGYFDIVLCAHALDLLPDMETALTEWVRVLKPGGVIAFSAFGAGAFEPMAGLLLRRIEERAVPGPCKPISPTLHSIVAPGRCLQLLQSAGITDGRVAEEQMGYHLRDAGEWWEVVMGSGFRDAVDMLDPVRAEMIRNEHLAEVGHLAGENGLWLDAQTLFAFGHKS
ncbi:MAG: class I SAM-dependent methyltransferase [Acidiferrobacterales bacterium]